MDIFGKENVFVLPYEVLKEDLNRFLFEFYQITEFDPYYPEQSELMNEKKTKEIFKYNPILSRYGKIIFNLPEGKLKKFILKNDRGVKKLLNKHFTKEFDFTKEKLTEQQKEQIMNMHKESNQKLAELIGIDLGQYGYF